MTNSTNEMMQIHHRRVQYMEQTCWSTGMDGSAGVAQELHMLDISGCPRQDRVHSLRNERAAQIRLRPPAAPLEAVAAAAVVAMPVPAAAHPLAAARPLAARRSAAAAPAAAAPASTAGPSRPPCRAAGLTADSTAAAVVTGSWAAATTAAVARPAAWGGAAAPWTWPLAAPLTASLTTAATHTRRLSSLVAAAAG